MTSSKSGAEDGRERARRILETESAFAACGAGLIGEIIRHARPIRLAKGDTMYRQGEPGDSMMIVVAGSLKVTNVTSEGKEVVLGFLRPGALTGEIAVLDGKARTASVVALEPVEAVAIYRRDLIPLLRANPDAMFALLEGLCGRLRSTNLLVESQTLEAEARVAACLVRLGQEHGQDAEGGTLIDLKITQRDLGSHLGLTRETVSRTLSAFRDEGLVELSGTTILLKDSARLAEIAEGSGA
jgi:CRP-like cAMP-binding protein